MEQNDNDINKEKEVAAKCKKVSFINETTANFYINKLQNTSTREKVPQRAYLCEICLNWHLTSKPDYENTNTAKYEQKINNLHKIIASKESKIEKLTSKLEDAYEKIYKLNYELHNNKK